MTETKPKERPILFASHLVPKLLDGSKTVTRRPFNEVMQREQRGASRNYSGGWTRDSAGRWWTNESGVALGPFYCPFGRIGERLWVRETWKYYGRDRGEGPEGGIQYRGDLAHRTFEEFANPVAVAKDFERKWTQGFVNQWRPSIHMPKWASRLTLEITDVSVERLQDITEEDAQREGVQPRFEIDAATFIHGKHEDIVNRTTHRIGFKHSWDALYKSKGYGWDSNCWCWVIRFRKLEL
jgi:hypothetical protein